MPSGIKKQIFFCFICDVLAYLNTVKECKDVLKVPCEEEELLNERIWKAGGGGRLLEIYERLHLVLCKERDKKAENEGLKKRIREFETFLKEADQELTEYDETMVRKYIREIKVYEDHLLVCFEAGIEVEIDR